MHQNRAALTQMHRREAIGHHMSFNVSFEWRTQADYYKPACHQEYSFILSVPLVVLDDEMATAANVSMPMLKTDARIVLYCHSARKPADGTFSLEVQHHNCHMDKHNLNH